MQTWSVAYSREGFSLYVEKTPLWAYLLSWPIGWILYFSDSIAVDSISTFLYKVANRLTVLQDRWLTRVFMQPLSSEDARKIDAEFVDMCEDY